jgi:hypothetical protein
MRFKHRKDRAIGLLALVAFGLFYAVVCFNLPSRWWFEEDPIQFAYVAQETLYRSLNRQNCSGILPAAAASSRCNCYRIGST